MKGTGMPMRQAGPDYRDSVLNFTRGEWSRIKETSDP
jgi:hypothetical protein